jgi:hypothetical protein
MNRSRNPVCVRAAPPLCADEQSNLRQRLCSSRAVAAQANHAALVVRHSNRCRKMQRSESAALKPRNQLSPRAARAQPAPRSAAPRAGRRLVSFPHHEHVFMRRHVCTTFTVQESCAQTLKTQPCYQPCTPCARSGAAAHQPYSHATLARPPPHLASSPWRDAESLSAPRQSRLRARAPS